METKNNIRKRIKNLFLKQNREELDIKNREIQERVLEYIVKNDVQNICIYENMNDEVGTKQLIWELEKAGKSVYTPQVISETEMILIDIQYWVYEKNIDVFIIPGRAFTINWKRLGRGKWYYDRFLAKKQYKHSKKLGICYDFQILEGIQTKAHDINMNTIITNTDV